jgi:tetratricopeptide (TPR) repeat protein
MFVEKKAKIRRLKYISLHIILLFFLSLAMNILPAQTGNIFVQLNEANSIMAQEPDRALDLIQSALKESFSQKNQRGEAYCNNSLGALNYQLGRYPLAIENYEKAIPLFVKLKESEGLYNSEKYLAISYEGKGELTAALNRYEQLLIKIQIEKKIDDEIDIRRRMARIYQIQGQATKAQFQFGAISDLEQNRGNEAGYIDNLNNLGNYNIQQQDTTQAIGYYQNAIDRSEEQGYQIQTQQSYENLSNVYRGKRDFKREISTRAAANQSYKRSKNKKGEVSNNLEIGKLYLQQGETEKAIPYLQATIDLSKELGELESKEIAANTGLGDVSGFSNNSAVDSIDRRSEKAEPEVILPLPDNSVNSEITPPGNIAPDSIPPRRLRANSTEKETQTALQLEAYENLAKAYEQRGELEEALKNYKEAAAIADSLARLRDFALREALDLNGKLAERDEEILRMQQQKELNDAALRQQRNISLLLMAGFIVLLIAGFFVLRNYRAKRRANKLLALRSLRSQMNPHFIFNSLNSINSFISRNDERSANRYLSNFSRLMRTVMEHSSHDFVPLSAELQVLELYLSLEHFRFADKFEYTFEVDPNIQADQIEVPPMLIQPYIENAIWHGLRYKETPGVLRVAFRQDGDKLIGVVEDNGIGRKRSAELKTKNQRTHKSTGLKNTAQRVELINSLYGKGVSVSISDLEEEREDCGTRVEIVIPYQNTLI